MQARYEGEAHQIASVPQTLLSLRAELLSQSSKDLRRRLRLEGFFLKKRLF